MTTMPFLDKTTPEHRNFSYHIRSSWRQPSLSRTKPCPYMDSSLQKLSSLELKTSSCQTPKSLRCHHVVTCNGHPSRCWLRLLQLSSPDQERHSITSPEELALRWNSTITRKYWKQFQSQTYCSFHTATLGTCNTLINNDSSFLLTFSVLCLL
jgi:hypothetical protein